MDTCGHKRSAGRRRGAHPGLGPALPRPARALLAFGLLLGTAAPGRAQLPAGFDLDMLRERGIDPSIAEYFKETARFHPGINSVTLFVNDQARGRVDARFDDKGELCFDKTVLDKGGLKIPEKVAAGDAPSPTSAAAAASAQCYDFKAAYPQTAVELRPGKEEVALVVPTDSLRPGEADFSGYSSGGTAALANYDIVTSRSQFGSNSSKFLSANLEYGFNASDWIVRARQMYARQDSTSQRQHLYAFAQHTLVDERAIFQGGQINVLNTSFATGPITGAQWVPETALSAGSINTVMVEGIAQTQARVEVRQNNALIYSTIVPGGPFALSDLPLLNSTSDLEVTVIEANGAQRRFTVPAATLHGNSLARQRGYSLAVGKLRALGNSTGRQPWLATFAGGWPLGRNSTVTAGLLGATGYQGASWGWESRLADTSLSLQQRLSHATAEAERGTQFTVSASSILAETLSLGLSTTQQTLGYRDLSDTTINRQNQLTEQMLLDPSLPPTPQYARYRGQYSASLSWSNALLGGFNASYSRSTQFYGASTQRLMLSWGRSFDFGSVNFNLEHQLGGTANTGSGGSNTPVNTFYFTVSIPLGKRSMRGYVNNSSGYQRLGASYSEQFNDFVNYTVSADRNQQSKDTDLSAQLAALPRYAQVTMGYGRYGSGSTSMNGGLRGGMVAHKDGFTLSPYPVQDTFGIVKVGDVPDIKVNTSYGPVWTDWNGQAVVSQLPPYSNSRLEIVTKSLPRNIDLKNGLRLVDAGRGSVNHVEFEVLRVRRIMLNTRSADGTPLPKGAFVLDANKQFLTTVVDDGQVFLLNGTPALPLHVALPEEHGCTLQFSLPDKPDPAMFYETAEASCRPDAPVPPKGVPHASQ